MDVCVCVGRKLGVFRNAGFRVLADAAVTVSSVRPGLVMNREEQELFELMDVAEVECCVSLQVGGDEGFYACGKGGDMCIEVKPCV